MAIQKGLLNDTVSFEKAGANSTFGETYEPPIELTNVRIHARDGIIKSSLAESRNDKTTILFYDLKYSNPSGVTFNPKDKIVYNNHEYFVEKVIEAKGRNFVSHYEVKCG